MSHNDSINDAISLSWTKSLPLGVGFIVKEFLPPLLVIAINSILILVIHLISSRLLPSRLGEPQPLLVVPAQPAHALFRVLYLQYADRARFRSSRLLQPVRATGPGTGQLQLAMQGAVRARHWQLLRHPGLAAGRLFVLEPAHLVHRLIFELPQSAHHSAAALHPVR